MGQKVHPRGLRLGIIYNWNSRWFFQIKEPSRFFDIRFENKKSLNE